MMLWQLLRETWREWRDDRATLQGAALAFYALFSVAPLLMVATAVLGMVFGQEDAERRLSEELVALTTPEMAETVHSLVQDAGRPRTGFAAGLVGVVISLYGASRGFFHLQSTLNQIWGVRSIRGPGVVEIVRLKLAAFASVALCGTLLLASTIASIVFHVVARHAAAQLSVGWRMLRLGEEISTFGFAALLLMVVYKTLPDVRIRWRDVLVGSLVSAALFLVGKHLVSLYLRHVSVASSFGAASALAALMIYFQYMAQVLLFGAEFTYVFARSQGRAIEPGVNAARVLRYTLHGQTGASVTTGEIDLSSKPGPFPVKPFPPAEQPVSEVT